jgi:hypothetical protein
MTDWKQPRTGILVRKLAPSRSGPADSGGNLMPLLQPCQHPGCTTRTIGTLCVAHEPVREPRVFPRGRPFPPLARELYGRPVSGLVRQEVAAVSCVD